MYLSLTSKPEDTQKFSGKSALVPTRELLFLSCNNIDDTPQDSTHGRCIISHDDVEENIVFCYTARSDKYD